MCELYLVFFFFFQAEDGIRDLTVTGVQTCALPILRAHGSACILIQRDHVLALQPHRAARGRIQAGKNGQQRAFARARGTDDGDRKSTRLNSSHSQISYAVFCLKKKKKNNTHTNQQKSPKADASTMARAAS